ncbi:flagellar hook-associated protein FlgL [Ectothiorhodospira variabilis]|uniref:flagellar hook-associated protein FlgL n=1 Tax=Ectothiorhodospira variabilis TaxID=505694 RepID=UPI001EFA3D30|nr:flagellar hook-associated protein FlgL [Ectothiorhodospira variabilis]MCG5493045.1 flagellar hook-associated protein FlgL [Ectothiorhodospira variabilis]MCG5502374.1 flagellar hook-associated protein FlgL [Ectothiorhodospira variabilis]MCG5505860.1 flagellar hook-associated protein FlgL [Ectothiorhodospira variabilis]
MRISTSQIFQNGIDVIQRQQAEISRTQNQLGTGRRILSPSDDPSGSVQALQFESRIEQTKQFQRNGGLAEQRLRLTEVTLASVGDGLQRIRELSVKANNATETDETRRYIAGEMQQVLNSLVDLGNTRDANGEYLFAGYKSQTQPFVMKDGEVKYQGDDNARQVDISPVRKLAVGDPGNQVFGDAGEDEALKDGNGTFTTLPADSNTGSGVISAGSVVDRSAWENATGKPFEIEFSQNGDDLEYRIPGATNEGPFEYVSGESIEFEGIQVDIKGTPADGDSFTVRDSEAQSLFAGVRNIIDTLQSPVGTSTAPVNNAINRGLSELDNALGHVLDTRATVGARLNALENQDNLNRDQILQLETTISEIRDLDYAEAISRFNLQQVGLQAAQQSYTQVARLTLFDYIR